MSMQGFMENLEAFVQGYTNLQDRTKEGLKESKLSIKTLPKDKQAILGIFSPAFSNPEKSASFANLSRSKEELMLSFGLMSSKNY